MSNTKQKKTAEARIYVPQFGAPLEHAIVRKLLDVMRNAGFVAVAVWDDEEYVYANGVTGLSKDPTSVMSTREVLDAVFSVGVSTLHFAPAGKLNAWGSHGVLLVTGNNEDIISDHHSHKGAWNDTLQALGAAAIDSKAHAFTIHINDEIEVANE